MEIDLTPTIIDEAATKARLGAFVEALGRLERAGAEPPEESEAESLRQSYLARLTEIPPAQQTRAAAAGNLFTDLVKSGWSLRWERGGIWGSRPGGGSEIRAMRRAQLANRRLEQLREPATRAFIASMEGGHIHSGQVISVFHLMRDGRDFARSLRSAKETGDPSSLETLTRPYMQVIDTGAVCQHTGFLLQDIWRYFRHTWSTAYESIPGRSMQMLVRDAAAPYHPVIGIASLASAASVQPVRDREIGWTREQILQEAREQPSARLADWVLKTLDSALSRIYKQDFIEERVLPHRLPERIAREVIDALTSLGESAHHRHVKQAERREHKGVDSDPTDAEGLTRLARSDLYRWKRATELASLLEIRNCVLAAYKGHRGKARLASLLSTGSGRSAFEKLLRRARSATVGTAIADLNVCGAVAPYNELLAGKLVAMLAVSPQSVVEYKSRYRDQPSWIASRMAGEPVVRDANLVFIGTTSLYGTRPSQYDRASYPASLVGGREGDFVRYRFLGDTMGVGTAQFSAVTKNSIEKLLRQINNQGERVKNIFGEGANAKLRVMREGVTALGIRNAGNARDEDSLLTHGMTKTAYGVGLVEDLRDYLLGFSARPKYIFDLAHTAVGSARISAWWLRRWVWPRLDKPGVLDRIAEHSLIRPVRHGARVILPDADVMQLRLV